MIVLKENEAVYKAVGETMYRNYRTLMFFDKEEELPEEIIQSFGMFQFGETYGGHHVVACYKFSYGEEYAIEDENGEIEFDGKRYKKI